MQFLYIIKKKSKCGQKYKIGRSINVEQRLKQGQTFNISELEINEKFECANSVLLENIVHKKLNEFRIRGEWFIFNEQQLLDAKIIIRLFIKNLNDNNFPNICKSCKYVTFKWDEYRLHKKSNDHILLKQKESNENKLLKGKKMLKEIDSHINKYLLINKNNISEIIKCETTEVEKYKHKMLLYQTYNINANTNTDKVLNFVVKDAKLTKLQENIENINRFILSVENQDDKTELNTNNMQKHKFISDMLNRLGFTNGIKSNNILYSIDKFDVSIEEIKKIRILFTENGDIGRFSAQLIPHKLVLWLSRLIDSMYGCKIEFYNKKSLKININYRIVFNTVVKEYIVLKYPGKADILPFKKTDKFIYYDIHGIKGSYQEYIELPRNEKQLIDNL